MNTLYAALVANYLGLIVLLLLWQLVFAPPTEQSLLLNLTILVLPLLLTGYGVWKKLSKTLIFLSFLSTIYIAIGIMEWWTSPEVRSYAIALTILATTLHVLTILYVRAQNTQRRQQAAALEQA